MSEPTPEADLRVISLGAAAEDVAAVTSVLRSAIDELAALNEIDGRQTVSGWQRSQRPIRSAIVPGPGAWRNFSA
jgi:hypothetical protein